MTGLNALSRAQRCSHLLLRRSISSTRAKSVSQTQKSAISENPGPALTLADVLATSASESYLGTLSKSRHEYPNKLKLDKKASVKAEIANLLHGKSYDALLAALARWTSRASPVPWKQVISQREMAYILSHLIDYQKDLLLKASTMKLLGNSASSSQELQMAHVREVREQIRAIFANLLTKEGQEVAHLYAKTSGLLEESSAKDLSGYIFTEADYENIIQLELNNGKMDLASRWFRRMELQYQGKVFDHMTQRLWLLKFMLFGNGQPSLWRVEKTALNDDIVDPRQSRLKPERKWLDLFQEYSSKQHKSRPVFSNELVAVMLASIGYGQNVSQAARLVEVNWGISEAGELVPGFEKPAVSDPLYPDLHVLTTVVVAMLYNHRYIASMAYINAFQQHYGLELDKSESKQFWDQIFRWAEIATKYSEARAFQHFMNETGSPAFFGSAIGLSDDFHAILEEAKKSANFDYERFLKFVADLRGQRVGFLAELWKCFHQSEPGFSVRPYRAYLRLAEEYLERSVVSDVFESEQLCSNVCYEILTKLVREHGRHTISQDSFNVNITAGNIQKIRALYLKTMKVLIHAKGQTGRLGEIPHILSKWSLDADMRSELSAWAQRQEQVYLQRMNELEAEKQKEEEEDGFLDLM
ncbi:hypothetical protein OXX80_003156 [Metschnikowia pulcherrima]